MGPIDLMRSYVPGGSQNDFAVIFLKHVDEEVHLLVNGSSGGRYNNTELDVALPLLKQEGFKTVAASLFIYLPDPLSVDQNLVVVGELNATSLRLAGFVSGRCGTCRGRFYGRCFFRRNDCKRQE